MVTSAGPLWTQARLKRVLRLRYGSNASGTGPDVAAVAAAMHVTPRTVQRWLHAPNGRSLAHIPPRRLQALIEGCTPLPSTLKSEAITARNAEAAIFQIQVAPKGRGLGVDPGWVKKRWTEQHLVALLRIKVAEGELRQLAVTRNDLAKRDQLSKRGVIQEVVVVPTYFHAIQLTHAILTDLSPWRFRASAQQVKQGMGQSWLADAPPVKLSSYLQRLEDAEHGRQDRRRHSRRPQDPSTSEKNPTGGE